MVSGAGIGGLTLALSLHAAGIRAAVVEAADLAPPLGTGVSLPPSAVAELTALGLGETLAHHAVAPAVLSHYDRHGGHLWSEPRGLGLGHPVPQYSIRRAVLQDLLLQAVRTRLGTDAVRTSTAVVRFHQSESDGVRVALRGGGRVRTETALALIGADGLRSAVRAGLHPGETPPRWSGVWWWRGLVPWQPVLGGRTVMVAGGGGVRLHVHPVSYPYDDGAQPPPAYGNGPGAPYAGYPYESLPRRGQALLHWTASVRIDPEGLPGGAGAADWNRRGRLAEVLPHYAGWRIGDLDVPALLAATPRIQGGPLVGRAPLTRWGQGRVSLIGDAAHPLLPAAPDGTGLAVLDAAVLARCLARTTPDRAAGMRLYESHRAARVAALDAMAPPPCDTLLDLVAARAPDGFAQVGDVLTADELNRWTAAHRALEAAAEAW
ncbi:MULTISPECIES: FAD-dependent monooxygenase [unclassified Streptomyces]|uniref:FAD-dependent monooxygenase n=1 Tax=unclassified Streptomyces TaxID=2593676 RepID=UPI002D21E40D|nr:FAD-dependent monooxygenase [Streptomyces sp. NRRL F-5630]